MRRTSLTARRRWFSSCCSDDFTVHLHRGTVTDPVRLAHRERELSWSLQLERELRCLTFREICVHAELHACGSPLRDRRCIDVDPQFVARFEIHAVTRARMILHAGAHAACEILEHVLIFMRDAWSDVDHVAHVR